MNTFWTGFEKQAAKSSDDSTWWEKQKGVVRASADKNLGGIAGIANTDLIKKRLGKGLKHGLIGGAAGAGLGAIAGGLARGKAGILPGAAIGGAVGAFGGDIHGAVKADKEYLKEKGITSKAWGRHEYSPEAKAKYIDAHRK